VRIGLTRNFGLKVLAVVVAFLLWFFITGENESVRVYPARIDFLYSQDHVMTEGNVDAVSVYLRGPELLLRRLDPGALSITVDLRGGGTGSRSVVLTPENNLHGLPPGLSVERLDPQALSVRIERKVRRAVPVMPRVEGEPSAGCRFAGYDITPPEVLVEAAESQLSSAAMVQTEPIDITGRCEPFMLSVAVTPDKPTVRLVSQRPVSVTVRIERTPAE